MPVRRSVALVTARSSEVPSAKTRRCAPLGPRWAAFNFVCSSTWHDSGWLDLAHNDWASLTVIFMSPPGPACTSAGYGTSPRSRQDTLGDSGSSSPSLLGSTAQMLKAMPRLSSSGTPITSLRSRPGDTSLQAEHWLVLPRVTAPSSSHECVVQARMRG